MVKFLKKMSKIENFMKNSIKVAIPLKTNSERVKNKNLRPFYNTESLFDIKAKQLLKVFCPEDVYVSSENPDVEKICKRYGFNFHLRDISLTLKTARENNIVKAVVGAIEDKTADVMWVQVTQPLFNEFEDILNLWRNLDNTYDSLAVVKKVSHHILDNKGNPVNFNFGYWHKISQDLPLMYEVTWSAFIMKRQMLDEALYQIGRNPYLYETSAPLVDINDPLDFETAQILYGHYLKNKA